MASSSRERWWTVDKSTPDAMASAVTGDIAKCELSHVDMYERCYRLMSAYDPNDPMARSYFGQADQSFTIENICKADVDTVTSVAARQSTRPVFLTDEGDWKAKRRAADLGRFAEGLAKLVRLQESVPRNFKDSCVVGTGFRHWEIDPEGCISFDRYLVFEVRVNESEAMTQAPRSMHLLKYRDREWLQYRYPDHAEKIDALPDDPGTATLMRLDPMGNDQVLVRTSYHLPVGKPGTKGYRPGRKVVSTTSLVLLDEDYDDDRMPVTALRWDERTTGYFGGSLVETILPTQNTMSRMNRAIDAQVDLHASPVTFINANDINLIGNMKVTKIGRLMPYNVEKPQTVMPPVIAPEVMNRMEYLNRSHKTHAGISEMHSSGKLPPRLETGAAVRESNDIASERFSIQEKAEERDYLDCIEVMIMLCKRNHTRGFKTPDIGFSFAGINKRLKWADVDMKDVVYQIQAAPQLSRTLAGRLDTIAAWQAQQLIDADTARHLINHPDLDSAMSLYDAYMDNIDRIADMLLEGHYIPPDPRGPLELGLDAMTRHYFKAIDDGAAEEDLENLRQWQDQMAFIIAKRQPPAPQAAPPPGAVPMAA